LGYHYQPLDYAISAVMVTNTPTVTIGPGTALATFGSIGLWLADACTLACQGTPRQRNQFVRYNAVQEEPVFWGDSVWTISILCDHGTNAPPAARFRFTDFNALSGELFHLYASTDSPWDYAALSLQDSRFHGGAELPIGGPAGTVCGVTNTLFERISTYWWGPMQLSLYNNLFRAALLDLGAEGTNNFTLRDNSFDTTLLSDWGMAVVHSHNAYIRMPTNTARLYPPNPNDVVLADFTYTNGPLGTYYQLSTNLVNAGSRSATNAGLYHYTTQLSQAKETNSVVDIGLH
jgi:hypothetical protein